MRESTERWRELAQQAQTEQDPEKLLLIIKDINQLLTQKQSRLRRLRRGENNGDIETELGVAFGI